MPRRVETDRGLFLSAMALSLVGAVMVYSASAVTAREQYGNGYHFLVRQLLWLAVGIAGMFGMMNLDYRRLREPRFIFTFLFVVMTLLVGVFFLDKSHATHRWIRIGPASLQPSEMAKLAIIFYLAWFLEERSRPRDFGVNNVRHTILPVMGVVVTTLLLVVLEPDLGTALEIFVIALGMMFIAGLSEKYIIGAGVASVPAVYFAVVHVAYRYERVMAFLHPDSDPQGRGFQLMQSLIAVGSGGLTGVGLMESKQKLFYLPEAHTDFIYAVLCEELGFIGGALVLGLFAYYAWRGIRAAYRAPDDFGRFLGLGITLMVASQALINLGVVLGMLPTKGIPLPFVSYGGSSLLVMLLATGVLLNISQQGD
ncbi:MAG TPA: putative lipid II flippase FtsW [Candidatus Binataceae bacterium]|nr:putative lipid II flippase FtsW [Candidatus Binataceae bacterium]